MEETLMMIAMPVFVLTMIMEWRRSKKPGVPGRYVAKDTVANLAMGLGYLVGQAVWKAVPFAAYVWLYQHRLFDFEMGLVAWIALFFLDDFFYYIFHLVHHKVRFFWAIHVNHHSSEEYNLSTALRQPWLEPFFGTLFWLPLPLLGFPPEYVLLQQVINLLYQYWVHTQQVRKMPAWYEYIFNTPSHHRAHHGSNPQYIDVNYGGILIIWDRLFGTFEPEVAPVRYGIINNIQTYNPVTIAFHEMYAIARDVRDTPTVRGKLFRIFGSPEAQSRYTA